MKSKNFLKSIENTYSDNKYINVVGLEKNMQKFLNYAKKHNIWTYRLYTFCVYQGISYKGIFCKKTDIKEIRNFIKNDDGLILNAINPFF